MEIIRYAGLKPHRLHNGGGLTREVAALRSSGAESTTPAETGAASGARGQDAGWQWRVSIAEVSKAGAFSAFPGMDCLLTVIDGDLLLLSVDGAEHPLEIYRPFRFSGDAASSSTLPTGDVRTLTVITRRGAFKGYTSIVELSKKRAHPVFEGQLGILLQGQARVSPGLAGAEHAAGFEAASGSGSRFEEAGFGAERDPVTASGKVPAAGPETLERYDAVAGSDTATPEILGRGFLAVVSIDTVAGG